MVTNHAFGIVVTGALLFPSLADAQPADAQPTDATSAEPVPEPASAAPAVETTTVPPAVQADAPASAAPPDTPAPVASSPPKLAEPPKVPEWISRVEVGGLAMLFYRLDLSPEANGANTFDIARAYLTATAKPADHVKLRFTLDAPNREAVTEVKDGATAVVPNAGKFDVILKHAYAEVYDVPAGLSVKLGQLDLPFVPYEEKIWTFRPQGSVFVDREGYLSSTDLGVSVGYTLPDKYLEAQLALVNGETFNKPEISWHKDVHGRVTVRPFAGMPAFAGAALTVFGSAGVYQDGDDQVRSRLIPQLSFESEHWAVAADLLLAWDPPTKLTSKQPALAASTEALVMGRGASVFGWLDLGVGGLLGGALEGLRLMGRVDMLDPEIPMAANAHLREIVGVGYRLNKYAQILVDADFVQREDNDPAAAESRLFVHTAVGF